MKTSAERKYTVFVVYSSINLVHAFELVFRVHKLIHDTARDWVLSRFLFLTYPIVPHDECMLFRAMRHRHLPHCR
jgi:hypothetical protein